MPKIQMRRAQRIERRGDRRDTRAARLEQRVENIRERRPEAAGRRVTGLERRAENLRGRAAQAHERADALGLPYAQRGDRAPTPTVPNEPYQNAGGSPDSVPGVSQPFTFVNPRTPYAGGPTIQQQATPGVEGTISPYYVGAGPTGQAYEDMLTNEYRGIDDRTTNRFSDMFSKYVDVANREAGRQANQIATSLGSRGALYSSANLAQQADLRQRTSQDIANAGQQFLTGLENQRQNAFQTVLQGQAGLASAEYGAREAAMGRAWQDFLRQSDVPPIYSSGQQWAASRPGAGNYARY